MRLRGITTVEEANRFLREHYMAEFNARFQVAAGERGSAFVPCRRRDLDLVFALQFERTVNRDNSVRFQDLTLQIERQSWRGTLAGCNVTVHHHLDGAISLTYGPHRLGQYTADGDLLGDTKMSARKAVEKTAAAPPWKTLRVSRLSHSLGDGEVLTKNRTFHFL